MLSYKIVCDKSRRCDHNYCFSTIFRKLYRIKWFPFRVFQLRQTFLSLKVSLLSVKLHVVFGYFEILMEIICEIGFPSDIQLDGSVIRPQKALDNTVD